MAVKAVFIDKDGTLVEDVPYNVNPAMVTLAPGAVGGLRTLATAGFQLVVVSNQSGVARGYFSEDALAVALERVRDLLAAEGVHIAGFFYCPHHPRAAVSRYRLTCGCRKPGPGLLLRAAQELGVDLPSSWMVGDILDDIEAGRRAGCRTVLIRNGGETEWRISPLRTPHFMARSLDEAARQILGGNHGAELARPDKTLQPA